MKPLLLGESPNFMARHNGYELESLAPRLIEFAGLVPAKEGAYAKLLEYFDVVNACDEERWCVPIARGKTQQVILSKRPRVIVCLGRRVGELFEIPPRQWNRWKLDWLGYDNGSIRYPMTHKHEFLVTNIPHPSGRCRVYNDLDERERAHFTMRQALDAAERLSRGEKLLDVARLLLPAHESRNLSPEVGRPSG